MPEDPEAYEQAVARLLARRPMMAAPTLDRMTTLAELLGRPDQSYPSVHVTGTNGKGSVARMVSSLFGALGLTAGCYTSPHLQDVRERIRVADEPISRADLMERLEELQPYLDEVDARHRDPLHFFEVLTALAFAHFADAPVDVGVFEVGMGGRWDPTNLVRGEVAVLTPIAVDHPELGREVAEVAEEKAGVVKEGAVVVTGPQAREAMAAIEAACRQRGAELVVAGDEVVAGHRLAVGGQHLDLEGRTDTFHDVFVPLHGRHQAANAALALTAVEAFLGFAGGIDPEVVREGFAAVRVPGRLEVVRRTDASTVVLDGAHNPAGAEALAAAIVEEFAFRHRVLVVGVIDAKDAAAVLAPLVRIAEHVVVTAPPSPRAVPPQRLAALIDREDVSVETAADVPEALELASGLASEEDGVVVAGSLHLVGAARQALGLGVG
jgi:dihydrofolate synthase / folylpolyglutamate synthase